MQRKHRIILISSIILILSLIFGTIYYKKVYNFKNVFDQMYSSRVEESYFLIPDTGLFRNMKELKGITNEDENRYIEYGVFDAKYKQNKLEENQILEVSFYTDKKQIIFYNIFYYKIDTDNRDNNEYVWLKYTYDLETKTLTKNNIEFRGRDEFGNPYDTEKVELIDKFLERRNLTWEELDKMQEEFFYDKFLTDFFNANKWYTKFSKDNLGDVTIVSEKGDDLKNSDNDAN